MSEICYEINPLFHSEPAKCYSCGNYSEYYLLCHNNFYGLCKNIICNICWYEERSSILGDNERESTAKKHEVECDDNINSFYMIFCDEKCSESFERYRISQCSETKNIKQYNYGFYFKDQAANSGSFVYESIENDDTVVVSYVVESTSLEEAFCHINPSIYSHMGSFFPFYMGKVGRFLREETASNHINLFLKG